MVTTAAEPARFRRGRQYLREDAVVSLSVHPGRITGEVQGGRPLPYEVVVDVPLLADAAGLGPVQLVPEVGDVDWQCDCPDWESPCKHAVAVALAFGERLRWAPEQLAGLRAAGRARPPGFSSPPPGARPRTRHLSVVGGTPRPGPPAVAALRTDVAVFLGEDRPHAAVPAFEELPPVDIPPTRVGVVDLAALVSDAQAWLTAAFPSTPRHTSR